MKRQTSWVYYLSQYSIKICKFLTLFYLNQIKRIYNAAMTSIEFIKMHGLGNDFVIFDLRAQNMKLSSQVVKEIARRRTGVGCDQLISIEVSKNINKDAKIRIWNADGGEVEACGNAMRCVGYLLLKEGKKTEIVLETPAGDIKVTGNNADRVSVDMGVPRTHWSEIPLAEEYDTLCIDISEGELKNPVGVSMGNPHVVFFVNDVDSIDLDKLGPKIEFHPLFPSRVNVGISEVLGNNQIRLRVWERGVGITNACGTAACAAVVAGVRRKVVLRNTTVNLDGGSLEIEWRSSDNRVIMTGPVSSSFRGSLI